MQMPISTAPAHPSKVSLRQIGLWSATALVIANMIGTGVFTTSGFLLRDLGSPWRVLGVWLAGGVLAALGALSYGALARRLPESGGEYLFLSRTLHPAAGYAAGWISFLVGFSAPLASMAFAFGAYTQHWLPDGAPAATPKLLGSALIVLFTALHAWHLRGGVFTQNGIVLLKVIFIVALIGYGLSRVPTGPVEIQGDLSWPAFAASLVWVSFSYSGWNAAVYIGGEVHEAERTLPRALLMGAGVVTVLYLGLNAVFVLSAPIAQLAGKLEIGRLAAEALGGASLAEAVTLLVCLALVSSVSSLILAGPRVYAKMAEDGYLPRALASQGGPPRLSIVVQSLVALLMLWSATYEALLTYIGFTLSLSAAATVVGLMRLRMREGHNLRVPGWPVVPLLFLAGVAWMTVFSIKRHPKASLFGLATILLGLVFWKASSRWTSTR